jgi:glyoxylase-like metal-dependent hydrolase (beta-lactamase superfamily II)
MSGLKIRPLSCGRFLAAEKSNFTYGANPGVKIVAPVLFWFIEGAEKRILVDTGSSDPQWAARYHHPFDRMVHEEPLNAIATLGLKPEEIDIIINTHLHWDHCFNNDLFPNARILVQKEEVRYAIAPLPCHALYYESQLIGMTPSWLKTLCRMDMIEGEMTIEPGITLVPLPGHTPGFQGVLVNLSSGRRCLIAGDTTPLWENWERNAQGFQIPSGIHVSLHDYYETYKKMASIADLILPGHDLKVLEKGVYE